MLSLGDAEVEYNTNFRLYLATEMSNPHFQADAAIKVNLINFTVTRRGLEEQLLGEVRDRFVEKAASMLSPKHTNKNTSRLCRKCCSIVLTLTLALTYNSP